MQPAAATGLPVRAARPGVRAAMPARTPPPPFVSPQSRARLVRIALSATAGASVLAALAAVERYRFASEALSLGVAAPGRTDAVSRHRTITDLLLAVTAIAAAVTWLAWFARAYRNLRALGATWTRLARPWAVVCCAVPIVNLFTAPWLLAEAWGTSDPQGDERRYPGPGLPPPLLLVWPALGLFALVFGVLGVKVSHRSIDYLGPARSGSPLEFVAAVLVLASVLVTMRLTAGLTARQEERAAHLDAAS